MTNKKQALKIVILGLDPGIQCVFNLNTKDTKKLIRRLNAIKIRDIDLFTSIKQNYLYFELLFVH